MPTVCWVTHYNTLGSKTESFPACRSYSGEVDRRKQIGHNQLEEVKCSRARDRGQRHGGWCTQGSPF